MRLCSAQKRARALEAHFMELHNNPPKPFNPEYSETKTKIWQSCVQFINDMPDNNAITREERAKRFRELYEEKVLEFAR